MSVGHKRGVRALFVFSCAVLVSMTGCTLSKPPSVTASAPEEGSGLRVDEYYALHGVRFYGDGDYSHVEVGEASWYGSRFHGNSTANGEIYDRFAMTAAHPSLDLPSIARVTNIDNGKSVVVRINDRGPYAGNRIIDLSEQAANRLEFVSDGVANVRVEVLPEETNLASRIVNGDVDEQLAGRNGRESMIQPARRGTEALVRGGGPGWVQTAAAVGDAVTMDAVRSGMVDNGAQRPTVFYVETGAHLIRENAERELEEMTQAESARVNSRLVDGTWIYRIQVGPHTSAREAGAVMSRLRDAGHADAVIVRD